MKFAENMNDRERKKEREGGGRERDRLSGEDKIET